jgi:enediyne biosynthesis protein E4
MYWFTGRTTDRWILVLLLIISGCRETDSGLPASSQSNSSLQNKAASKIGADVDFLSVEVPLGVAHTYHNGEESNQFTYLEAMGGGLAVFDFDRDGWQDIFFTGGGHIPATREIIPLPGTLWKNSEGKQYRNVSLPSHTDSINYYTQGAASADINNDGFPDLLVTGYGGLQFFVNQGDGTFSEEANRAGLNDPSWSTSAAFGDFDNDGCLDIYVTNYVDWSWEKHPECKSTAGVREICPPGAFHGLQDMIFMGIGDGNFRPVTSEAGLVPEGKGLGVVCADFNQDSKIDIYVANDTTNNFLYINRGNGLFDELGVSSGTALDDRGVSNGSMGISLLDFDGDLQTDIWVCNYENETFALYKNDGSTNFRYVTSSAGITALGTLFVAFGTVAADFDNDGDEDIAVANGHVLRFPPGNSVDQTPLMVLNNGRSRFTRKEFGSTSYFGKKWRGRGMVGLDFDREGDMDLATSHVNQPAAILENKTKSSGNWCSLELIGVQSNRDCIGARIVFRTDAKSYLRTVIGGGSYQSQNPYTVHCAFPSTEKLLKIEITWPTGAVQEIADLKLNQHHRILEQM